MGIRFDIVICGYILVLPYLVLTLLELNGKKNLIISKILFYFIFSFFTLTFFICAADIPYFNQFFSRFSVTAFEWVNSPLFVIKMIAQEPKYWMTIIPFLILSFIFYRMLKRIWKSVYDVETKKGNIYFKAGISILFLGFIFLGIRGRIDEKSPIRVGTAYFCNNAFLNQLGLNPNFTLVRSFLDEINEENKAIHLMNDQEAIAEVQKQLHIENPDKNFPLLRNISADTAPQHKYNIVLVIMESMSANKMKRGGNDKNLTPFLDSISENGYYFENFYSSGIHTFNGIFSTLFSFPAIYRQHPMKESAMLKYNGLASILKKNNYSTAYFTTHDGQFDNVEGFLRLNDFENIITKADYPQEKIKTTLGVPDDFMFEFAIPKLNELALINKPFLAAFMTASDHGPYYVPEYFNPQNSDIKDQIVEYADWSIKKFISLAQKQKWFDNTLFVFVADHGAPLDGTYEMPLSFNHIPFIIYNPKIILEKKTFDCIGGQIDIFPTLMGILNLPYKNNTLGIDLRKESRPNIFFNGDDKFGVIDKDWFLISRQDRKINLYYYQKKDTRDHSSEHADIADKMKNYAEANLQSFQYVILNGKQNYRSAALPAEQQK
jgi:phosphoglycerol transferase MdoB-like AlkP superfamily enzyme